MSSQTKYQVHSVRKNRFSNGIKIEKCWVKMKDKIKIGLTLCFPKSLKYKKFPAILQASPYRKDDDVLDLKTNTFFARHGYVSCQMDVRGTGASEGVFRDEYTKEEFRDIIEIINWLAHAPWSSGRVGIWGMSYSANNSLNIASLNPAPLKAIIAIDSSDHRYKDDVHYYGGCLQVFENIWSFGLDVEIFFPAWPNYSLKNPYFLKRFNSEPLIFRWLKHQTDGPYWQRGSLAPNYAKIRAPVYLIGGWLDGYTNSLKRIFEGLKGPKKVLVGPWPHALPDKIGPWPRIDWENESLKWWDYWLKGIDNKIMKEPEFTFYLQSYYPPSDFRLKNLKRIPGQWYSLKSNSFTFRKKTYFPSQNNQLKEEKSSKIFLNKIKYNPTLGISSKTWAPNGDGSYGLNQAKEDRLCLSFTTPPLSKKIEILGSPKCTLWVSSPVEKMNWVVRINDVAPDGTSHFVTRGILNGTHRMSHEKPTPLPLNKIIKLEIEAQFVSWVFKKGHKIRLVISNGEWPTIWPAPYKAETRLYFGGKSSSRLHLPLFDKKNVRKVKIKEIVTKNQVRELQPIWKVKKENGKIQVEFQDEYLNRIFLNKTDSGQISIRFRRYILVEANKKTPAIARFHGWADIFMKEKRLYAKTEFKMTSDKNFFYTELTREVREKNKLKFRKRWKRKIKRNGL